MGLIIKYFLALFVVIYAATVFVGRVLIVWKKTKAFPITYSNTDSVHDYVGRVYKVLLVTSIVSAIIYLTSDTFSEHLIPLDALDAPTIKVLGLFTAYCSMLWTIIAQHQMGSSWRIGISAGETTKFIAHGLFKYSRHPIYLGVTITSLSLFLIMPNVVNLIVFLLTVLTMSIQARLEEEYLLKRYGQEYLVYCKKTRRWL